MKQRVNTERTCDMKLKISYFPPQQKQGGYKNPYSTNYQNAISSYFDVLDSKLKGLSKYMPLGFNFLLSSFKADIYIINWLESVCFLNGGFIQFVAALIGLCIISVRRKKVIWMFHNIHPHQGDNMMSRILQKKLFNQSCLIISHSKEAASYARKKARNKVVYRCHPIQTINLLEHQPTSSKIYDVLIWGEILPYKGIPEFLEYINDKQLDLSIKVIGTCKDELLRKRIMSYCNDCITFEDRRASFEELSLLIMQSNYVLFPYKGDCISSSGALIDSIAMGGVVMGPNRGAFKDLAEENVCVVYTSYDEMVAKLKINDSFSQEDINHFVNGNTWEQFGIFLNNELTH